MIDLFFNILLSLSFAQMPLPTDNNTAADLMGDWKAIGYYYQGQWMPPNDPKMLLRFDFFKDGTNRLFWQREGEKSFCERKGMWFVFEGALHDEVSWVNPENGMDCGSDPDMQMGKVSQSVFWRDQGRMYLKIPLSDEYLYYVWELQNP